MNSPNPMVNSILSPKTNTPIKKSPPPILHQLPFISKNITCHSPRVPRGFDSDTQSTIKDLSQDTFLTKPALEPILSNVRKATSPKDFKEPLKNPITHPSASFKRNESKLVISKTEVVPNLKLKSLKEKMLLLSNIKQKIPKSPRDMNDRRTHRKDFSKSMLPSDLQEKKIHPCDFLESLQDQMFEASREKLLAAAGDRLTESILPFSRMSFASPRSFFNPQRSSMVISQETEIKENTLFKSNGQKLPKFREFLRSSLTRLEVSQEPVCTNDDEKVTKGHRRGQSWAHHMLVSNEKGPQIFVTKPKEVIIVKKRRGSTVQEEEDKREDKKFYVTEKRTIDTEILTSSCVNSMKYERGEFNDDLRRSAKFELKLHENKKKEEVYGLSSESRKNILQTTACCTSSKRRLSQERTKQTNEDEDLELLELITNVRDPTHIRRDSQKGLPLGLIPGEHEEKSNAKTRSGGSNSQKLPDLNLLIIKDKYAAFNADRKDEIRQKKRSQNV